ncbi:amidohydrolase [Leucobacter celer]|uniref:amidohydrolase n=1 Tax=Leucobacter celer TaxID=668625 RepID=UPI0006A79342|nr:amidohydrolase [Leucobacter celer]
MTGFADTLLLGGNTYDPGAARSAPGGVAIAEGQIIAVGPDAELLPLRGPDTDVVDVSGRLVIPGFQDAHIHPVQGGIEMLQCDLTGVANAEECLATVADYAAAHPDEEWIIGSGWSSEHFPAGRPSLAALDAVVPDRPAVLGNRDHHGCWVNTAALRLAGITRDTPDPADGRIGRDADGEPDGNLYEGAMLLVRARQPELTLDLARRGLLASQRYLHSLGVTAWQDAILGYDLAPEIAMGAYLAADRDGDLTMRVTGCLWWERGRGVEQIPEKLAARARMAAEMSPERWRGTAIKIMVDGVTETFTAAVHEPYRDACGHVLENRGISFFDPDELKRHVVALDAEGFTVHFHALGDRAVTEALDAVAAARAAGGDPARPHHLAHLQLVSPEDLPRFAELGAVANLQMLWAAHAPANDELTIPFVSPAHADRLYPFGELHAAGAAFAAGSDWPVSTPDPLAAIHVGVNRVEGADGSRPFGGERQRLDLATALTAYTAGTARVSGHAHETGRLLPGFVADLAVIDRDLFEIDPLGIAEARVLRTYVGGRQVFARE